MSVIYLIGSLRNPEIPKIAAKIREAGFEVFDDWFAAGPIADDSWQEYEKQKGIPYDEALKGYAAQHVFDFDLYHLNRSAAAVLVLPAGKSGHLELGYMRGQNKKCFMLFDKEPERWDVMVKFADGGVYFDTDKLIGGLNAHLRNREISDSTFQDLHYLCGTKGGHRVL
jgi:hypothetical protein